TKGFGLLAVAEAEEGPGREGGVAQPAEAVVPIQVAADPLRQGGRRRGDDGTRGGVGEELEHQGTARHLVAVGAAVAAAGRPALPPRDGEGELLADQVAQRRQYGRPLR